MEIVANSFASIESSISQALAHQSTDTLPASVKQAADRSASISVGGIKLHDEEAHQIFLNNALISRQKDIDVYNADREALIKDLRAGDITPMAVLPLAAWKAICQKSSLIRLAPNNFNEVFANRDLKVVSKLIFSGRLIATAACFGLEVLIMFTTDHLLTMLPVLTGLYILTMLAMPSLIIRYCARARCSPTASQVMTGKRINSWKSNYRHRRPRWQIFCSKCDGVMQTRRAITPAISKSW